MNTDTYIHLLTILKKTTLDTDFQSTSKTLILTFVKSGKLLERLKNKNRSYERETSNLTLQNYISRMDAENFVSELLMKVLFTEVYEQGKYRMYPDSPPEGGILEHVSRTTAKLEELISKVPSSDPNFHLENEIDNFIREAILVDGMWYEIYMEITDMVTRFVQENSSNSQE